MKNNWDKVRLGDIVKTSSGGTPSKSHNEYYKDGNIPWILSGDISQGLIYSANNYITQLGLENSSAKFFPKKTVLVAMYGATVGQVGILEIEATTNQAICGIYPNEKIDEKYLLFYFKSRKSFLLTLANGGAQPNISQEIIRNLIIPLPPIEVQRNIAKLLEKSTKIISEYEKILNKYDALIKSRFIEMFGDPVKNTKGWKTESLQQVAPAKPAKNNLTDKVWLLNLDMVESQTGKVIDYLYVNILDTGNSTYQFDEGNVLYSKLRPYLNKVVIPEQPGICTSELVPLRPTEKLNRYFLANLLRTDFFVNFINEKVAGAKMPRVSMDTFRAFDCILPPIELQNDFAAFVQQIDKSKFEIWRNLELCVIIIQKVFLL